MAKLPLARLVGACFRLCLAALLTGLPSPVAAADAPAEPDIGWCAFYPYVDVGMDELPGSAATILSVCAGGWGMEQQEGVFDFPPLEQQIRYAEQHGLKLALINEINPLYTPEWLRRKAKEAGESVRSSNGADGPIPSISSAVFATAQEELVRRTVEYVKQRDTTGVVRYYHPGAEWWFPLGERYNPADVAAFREWLRRRYGSIARLNARWLSEFASFDEVPAPRVDSIPPGRGKPGLSIVVSMDEGSEHCSWSTGAAPDPNATAGPSTFAAAVPGRSYTASAWVRTEDLRGYGAFVEIAWVGPKGGAPVALDDGAAVRGTEGWRQVSVTARAPKGAERAWVLLKMMGSGTAVYDDVELHEEGSGPNLAADPGLERTEGDSPPWSFQDWTGAGSVVARREGTGGRTGPGCLSIFGPPAPEGPGFRSTAAAGYDWSVFWQERAAEYINSLSALTKRLDPSRPTVTYLTMSWAFPAEWDEVQRSAIAPDEVAMRGSDIDIFGMQLCAADGDPYRATACLDLMRKYEKPLWTVDLVDFTSGVHIGYPAMDRITQSVIQHGAQGIIYCAWHIPSVLDYSFHPTMRAEDIHAMLTDAQAAVRLMEGMKVRPTGALVQPILPASAADEGGLKNDYRSFMGWYKILEGVHKTFDVVTLREIEQGSADLADYQWVLVPDCAYLSPRALSALRRYAREGGLVVSGGRFARYDEIGRDLDARPADFPRSPLKDYGRDYAGDPVRDTHAGNTPPLFLWRAETADTRRTFREARSELRPLLSVGDAQEDFELSPPDPSIRCVAYSGPGQEAAYLVNMGSGPVAEGTYSLRFQSAGRPDVSVYADTQPVAASCDRRGMDMEVRLPAFRTSCIVVQR